MRYEKPEVVVLESASAVIQSMTKQTSSNDSSQLPSVTAYQADE